MATFTPVWLQPADVKDWLRLNQQDTSDDDLLERVCAMTEPYVVRCRPEWSVPVSPAAALRLDAVYLTDRAAVRMDEWQARYPGQPTFLVGGHVVLFRTDPADDWGAVDPNTVVDVVATGADGSQLVAPLLTDTAPVTVRQAVLWATQRTPAVLTLAQPGADSWQAVVGLISYLPDAETYQGAVMYAAREYRRRNSPAGIELFGDVTSFVTRFDPDIDRALQTGAYARPVVS